MSRIQQLRHQQQQWQQQHGQQSRRLRGCGKEEEAGADPAAVARTKWKRCRRHRENAVINYCGAHIAAWSSIQNGYFVDTS